MDLSLIFLDELCCRNSTGLLQFNLFQFVSQIADPTLAEMGKNLKEAMKMLEDSQRWAWNRSDPIKRVQPVVKLVALVSCW